MKSTEPKNKEETEGQTSKCITDLVPTLGMEMGFTGL